MDRPERIQSRRTTPTNITVLERWKNHILIILLKETSDAIRLTSSSITPALITRWTIVIFGILVGGNGVYLFHWIASKLMLLSAVNVSSSILTLLMVLSGGIFLPNLTPLTGCDSWIKRISCTIGYLVICYMLPKIELKCLGTGNGIGDGISIKVVGHAIASLSSHQILCIMSGIWHMDRGDYNFRWVRDESQMRIDQAMHTISQTRQENHHRTQSVAAAHDADNDMNDGGRNSNISDEVVQRLTQNLLLFHFQAAIGIGVFWAAFEVYSKTVFFWGIAIHGLVHFSIYAIAYALGAS